MLGSQKDSIAYRTQCFAKSVTSFAVHSPFGFSFKSLHHSSLPTSGEHAMTKAVEIAMTASKDRVRVIRAFMIFPYLLFELREPQTKQERKHRSRKCTTTDEQDHSLAPPTHLVSK